MSWLSKQLEQGGWEEVKREVVTDVAGTVIEDKMKLIIGGILLIIVVFKMK